MMNLSYLYMALVIRTTQLIHRVKMTKSVPVGKDLLDLAEVHIVHKVILKIIEKIC
jgi:hypothetical protein